MKTKFIPLLIVTVLITGCTERTKKLFMPKQTTDIEIQETETITVNISCNTENIDNYLNDGWKIINQNEIKTTCSWKSVKSSKGCDIDLDKGCRITVPDKTGTEIEYLLERIKK
tara:strand:- start:34 stop:375 length:342 start_codon:yes stop_codon:yes gene_type:complete